MFFFFSTPRHKSDKLIKYKKGRVYQNYKYHDPWGRVLVLGRDHASHIVKLHNFFKKSAYLLPRA